MKKLPPYKHQTKSIDIMTSNDRTFDISDPGTGKTRCVIEAYGNRKNTGAKKMLVLAPKSILQPAWGNDIEKFSPNLKYVIANANNRLKAFNTNADIVITNHDAVKWIAANMMKMLQDRKSTRLNSSHRCLSYAVFCWKKKTH